MKDRIARRWHRLRRKLSGDRGFVEAGVAAAGAVLVVGALVGNGVAATIIDMSDGQTWLPDGEGRIVQINPATGQPERRLIVGDEGSELEISQRDGHLLVTDANSGAVTAIDLASLIASGSRGMGEGETKVLLGGGQVALATLDPGTIRAVDPLTLADRGRPYRTDALADAVMDDAGEAWLLSTDGMLRSITFNPTSRTWALDTERPVDGAGRASRLIPHAAGVTVAGPDGGVIVQVGAGRDLAASVPGLVGQIKPAERSPADLVPVSVPEEGSVVLLADRQALTVAVRDIGCDRPDVPAVHAGRVYVPCHGQGRVIVLDRDGSRAAEDILVPGGADASLVVDEGRLVVRSPNEGRIVVVQADGSTSMVDLSATQVPEHDIHRPTPARPGGAGGPGASPAGGSGPLPSGTPDRPTPEGTTPPPSTGEATIAPDRDESRTTAPDTPATSENPAPGAELDPDPADPVADGPPEPDPTDAEQREDDTDPAGREDPDPATEEESEGGGATPGDATTSPGAPGPGDDPSSSPPPATTPPTTTPPTTAPPPVTTPPPTTPPPTTPPPTTPPPTTPPPTTPPPTTPPPTTP
ncbi:MAG TPA: hypothetical protein VK024_05145, partial [Actinomycetaceae bacterium]|nr:hypothetical protein [Actinomycetaceae bacterium]